MSNSILTPAWKLDIKSSPKLVLVSLADQANDDGWCFSGIRNLMNRTGLSERAVQAQLNYLEDIGAITRHRRRQHQVTVYRVTPEAATCPHIVKIPDSTSPFDTMGSGAPKSRPAKSAGLKTEPSRPAESAPLDVQTRSSCSSDPQNLRSRPAAAAPIPVLTIIPTPNPPSGEWGVLVGIWPKKGNIEQAQSIFEALPLDDQQRIVALVPILKATPDWQTDNGRWIPTLLRFLQKGRWRLYPDARLRAVASNPAVAVIEKPLTDDARERGSAAAREAKARIKASTHR